MAKLHAESTPDLSTDRARAEALASSMCLLIGTMSLAELERIDPEIRSIIAERHTWARHAAAQKWCSVERYEHGSVVTRCRGRWSTSDDYETESRPPLADRCEACQEAFLVERTGAVAAGLRELRDAEPVTAPRPLIEFDMSDVDELLCCPRFTWGDGTHDLHCRGPFDLGGEAGP